MCGSTTAVWMAVGIGAGVAIGTATHALALWMCSGIVAGALIGTVAAATQARKS